MIRPILCAAVIVAGSCGSALAEQAGRFQIVTAPLGLEGESQGSTVLLDTQTGRTWHAIVDDKGRPRWRGIEFAGGAQGHAQAPDGLAAEAAAEGAAGEGETNGTPPAQ